MLSNALADELQEISIVKAKNLEKSQSIKTSQKPKILNAELDCSVLMNILEIFEDTLNQCKIDCDYEQVLKKLIEIETVFKKQILLMKANKKNECESVDFSKKLSSSVKNLCSEANEKEAKMSSFEEFLKGVHCPFCSKLQADKIKLIEHLDKGCRPQVTKALNKKPLSAFQILSNNAIKCCICPFDAALLNLRSYFKHSLKKSHISAYGQLAEVRNYTKFIYCAVCKILVANNYTQINFHLNHDIHKTRNKAPNFNNCMRNGIFCVYGSRKEFKCLYCMKNFKTAEDILKHFKGQKHPKFFKFFCEFCSEDISVLNIFKHFMANDHKDNENKNEITHFEMCVFCGFVCDDLTDLSLHMVLQCSAITAIKEKNKKFKEVTINNLKEDKGTDESNIKGSRVIVKDYDEILKSGETTIGSQEEQLLSKSEISLSSSDDCENEKATDIIDDRYSIPNEFRQSDSLQTLFQRVSSYLVDISQKLDSAAEIETVFSSLETCINGSFNLAGFAGCGLLFSVESISVYCEMEIVPFSAFSTENILVNDENVNTIVFLRKLSTKMSESELWQNITISTRSFLHIECRHKETQKIYTITCAKSAWLLTEMLRDCLKENEVVRSFCVIIKYWFLVNRLKMGNFEYVVMSLLIFFLISQKIAKLSQEKYYSKQDLLLEKKIQDMLDRDKDSSSQESEEAFDLQELFHKFLNFLDVFNFDKLAVYLPLPYPVPKKFLLKKLKVIESELSENDEVSKSSMYITESNSLKNLAFYVREEHLKALKEIVSSSIKNYQI